MVPQVPAKERPAGKIGGAGDSSQMPFVRKNVGAMTNPATGWPCQAPPWGELFAIDVNTAEVAWRIPFWRVESLGEIGVMDTGSYNIGGLLGRPGRLPFHRRHGRSALPRVRIENREAAVGDEAAR